MWGQGWQEGLALPSSVGHHISRRPGWRSDVSLAGSMEGLWPGPATLSTGNSFLPCVCFSVLAPDSCSLWASLYPLLSASACFLSLALTLRSTVIASSCPTVVVDYSCLPWTPEGWVAGGPPLLWVRPHFAACKEEPGPTLNSWALGHGPQPEGKWRRPQGCPDTKR